MLVMGDVIHTLKSHVTRFSSVENFSKKSPLKFIYIESNNDALASDHVAGELYKLDKKNTRVESKDPKGIGRVGVWTHPSSKRIYNDYMVFIMSEGRLRISEDLIGVNSKERIEELIQQMRRHRREEEPENDNPAFQDNIKVRYTGKGGGFKDDLLLSLMICTRWMTEKRLDENWINEANSKGIINY